MSRHPSSAAEVYMERVDPARGMQRYYALAIWPDLFGGYSLVREWGRIGGGSTITLTHQDDRLTALRALQRALAAKQRRGYAIIA